MAAILLAQGGLARISVKQHEAAAEKNRQQAANVRTIIPLLPASEKHAGGARQKRPMEAETGANAAKKPESAAGASCAAVELRR